MPSTISAGTTAGSSIVVAGDTTGNLAFQTNGTTTAMTITNSQNVGIGTTSPTVPLVVYKSSDSAINIQNSTSGLTNIDGLQVLLSGSNGYLWNYENGANIFGTNNTERMRITSAGRVGVANSSPEYLLNVGASASVTSLAGVGLTLFTSGGLTNNIGGVLNFRPGLGTTANDIFNLSICAYDHTGDGNADGLSINGGDGVSFATGGNSRNERMRITNGGDLLVGTTTKSNDEKVTIYQSANAVGLSIRSNAGPVSGNYESSDDGHNAYWTFGRDNQTTGNFVFYNTGNLRGSINNATGAYTATSDARVKKNIETLQYGLQEVLSLRPVLYLMEQESDDSKKHIGFIAQEVKAVMDEAVDDLQDERTQLYGLDKSGLVPVLVKAIQEQQAQIEQLKAEVQALKGAA